MTSEHKLLLTTDLAILTEHKTKREHYYEVSLTPKKKIWSSYNQLMEINDFFGSNIRKYVWRFDTELEARSKIMWAMLKWSA